MTLAALAAILFAGTAQAAPAQDVEIIGADGKPLPPDEARRALERFKADPPPPATPAAATPDTVRPTTGDIVVEGQRPRGSVVGDIPPTRSFTPLDIRAYGADDIGTLLQAIAPQVASNRGRDDAGPVVLLNGKRVSSFAELAKIPSEAIERMEVFPEELALKYGYRADQKVVNIVTYRHYVTTVARAGYTAATEGGRDTPGGGATYLRIAGDTRLTLAADYDRSGALLESERGIAQAGGSDTGRFRTLLPAAQRFVATGTFGGDLVAGLSSSLNARFEANEARSLLGLDAAGAPIARDIDTGIAHLGTAFGGQVLKWSWALTANYDRTRVDTLAGGARDRARFVNALADADLVLTGAAGALPAGPVSATLRLGGALRDADSRSSFAGGTQRTDLSRRRAAAQLSLDLPVASRRRGVLAGLGDLSVNLNAAAERLSDAGTLHTLGAGITWTPVPALNLIASVTDEEGAPTLEQLGSPLVVTPNARVFDLARGEAVDVTRIFGGNASLRTDHRRVAKLGVTAKPLATTDLTLSMDYVRSRIDDPIAAFPIPTPGIEAAFPDRFGRDGSGRLVRLDARPLNYARAAQQQVRWGINLVRPLGPVPPGMRPENARFVGAGADLRSSLPPGARIITPEPGSAEAKRFENVSSRLTLSLYYTLALEDRIVARDGAPVLDLLRGGATGARGGTSRHLVEAQAGAFRHGLGARLSATWRSGSIVDGLSPLAFAGYSTVSFGAFANLADRAGGANAPGWLKGARISLDVSNLFGARPRVRDAAGLTPLSYQPAYLDPLGRTVGITFRKIL